MLETILSQVDEAASELLKWRDHIYFEIQKGPEGAIEEVDICQFFKVSKYYQKPFKLYFNPSKYPPPSKLPTSKYKPVLPKGDGAEKSWNDLKVAIETAAVKGGSKIISNGQLCFVCQRHRCSVANTREDSDMSAYKKTTLVNNDKGNRRIGGQTLPRRTASAKPTVDQERCSFSFSVLWDEHGYFLKQTTGNPFHNGHICLDANRSYLPGRLVPKNENEVLKHLALSSTGPAVARNYLSSRLGRHLNNASTQYLYNKELSFSTPDKSKSLPKNDITQLIEWLQKQQDHSIQILYDVPVSCLTNTSVDDTSLPALDDITNLALQDGEIPPSADLTPYIESPTKLISDCTDRESEDKYLLDHSSDQNLKEVILETKQTRAGSIHIRQDDKIFLCCAWATVLELQQFKKHPEVLFCDATSVTNNTKNHLMTLSGTYSNTFCFSIVNYCSLNHQFVLGRTPQGDQFLILRIWAHNQKRTTFNWIFHAVLPNFI